MKKILSLILCFVILFSLAACNSTGSSGSDKGKSGKTETANQIDVDLTKLSKTMVYSEVYNMVTTPQDYIGKTVKMKGVCSKLTVEETKKVYYSCIIQDATACCQQGIEFTLKDTKARYPLNAEEICLVGTFATYEEDGNTYCTLLDAELVKK